MRRGERGISQADLAQAADVQRTTTSAIENSQRSVNIETLLRLCDVLDVELCVRDRTTPRPRMSSSEMTRRHTTEPSHDW